jgi:hypothetical protein
VELLCNFFFRAVFLFPYGAENEGIPRSNKKSRERITANPENHREPKKGSLTMKRTAIVTTAALMFAGFTSLSIAAENTATQNNQAPVVQSKSVVTPSPVGEKKNEVLSGKEHATVPQSEGKVVQNSAPVAEKTVTEKKESVAPMTVKSGQTEKKVEQKPQSTQPNTTPAK